MCSISVASAQTAPTPTYSGASGQIFINKGSAATWRLFYLPRTFNKFTGYDSMSATWFDSSNTKRMFYHNGITRLQVADKAYTDSLFAAITGGGVTLPQLTDSMAVIRAYFDSVDAVLFEGLSDLNNEVDTMRGDLWPVINGKIKYTDTSTIIATKQNLKDTAAAIRGSIPSLSGYVPYTGATQSLNMGVYNVTTNTVIATSSAGLHLHGTGGSGMMIGAGGGNNVTFDGYPTTVAGDSVLTTNSSGGLLRYDLKGKLATYLLKSDSTIYYPKYRGDTSSAAQWAAINGKQPTGTYLTPSTATTVITTTNFTTSYTIAATDARPILLTIIAQAGDLTFNAPTGLTDGQLILIRIKATGSSRALSWNAAFGAIAGPSPVALPTSVATTTWTTLQFIYNGTDLKTYLTGYVTN